MNNKIGIYYAFWEHDWFADYVKYARKVAGLEFDILELPAVDLLRLSKKDLNELMSISQAENLEYSFSMGLPQQYDLSGKDEGVRKAGIKYVIEVLKAISQLNGKVIGGVSYATWNGLLEDSKQAHFDRAVKSMKSIVPAASDLGIQYCVEVVNRFEQFILNTCDEAKDFVAAVGHPNLYVQLDTFHMNIEEDSFRGAIQKAGNLLGHFHIGENNRRTPGTGFLPWSEIFGALKEIDYTGRIVMEPFVMPGGEVGRDVKVWREIMPNADFDKESQKALEFVRKKCSEN
jgi:Sugar phosphate isomerases/epimerases